MNKYVGSELSSLEFDGRVAIVTGSGGGLGRQYALDFAAAGAKVVVNDPGHGADAERSFRLADVVVAEIKKAGGEAVASYEPVGSSEAAESIVNTAIDGFGRVDILVNNAGITRDGAFHKMTKRMMDEVIDVHFRGPMYLTQLVYALMCQQNYGRIVNITSASGLYGNAMQVNYAGAKMGVVGMASALGDEADARNRNIRINCVAPLAKTPMTEVVTAMGAQYDTADVSPLVLALAHDSQLESGGVYGAGAGRFTFITLTETSGVILKGATAKTVRDHMSAIRRADGIESPGNLTEALEINDKFVEMFGGDVHTKFYGPAVHTS